MAKPFPGKNEKLMLIFDNSSWFFQWKSVNFSAKLIYHSQSFDFFCLSFVWMAGYFCSATCMVLWILCIKNSWFIITFFQKFFFPFNVDFSVKCKVWRRVRRKFTLWNIYSKKVIWFTENFKILFSIRKFLAQLIHNTKEKDSICDCSKGKHE